MTAADLARRGFFVFPCLPGDKRPAVDKWEQRACGDPDRVARYWPSPRHNIGIACGPSGLVVIDLDTHGTLPDDWKLPGIVNGLDVLAQLAEWACQPWPSTYTVSTPSGGWHCYYRGPAGQEIRNSAGKLGPLIDVRSAGGYVIAVGSEVGGKPYELLDDRPPVPLPAWLCSMLAERTEPRRNVTRPSAAPADARLRGLASTVRAGQPGDRTGPLVWAAHRLAEMIDAGEATADDGEHLIHAAVDAGIRGGEHYARQQVTNVLRNAR